MTQQEQPAKQPQKAESKEDKFKFELIYLLPILASLLFGLLCAYIILPQDTGGISVAPISEDTPGAPIGNAIYFVVLVAVAATVFYLLIKRRSKRIIKALVVLAMTTASLLLSILYLSAVMPYFEGALYILIVISITLTVLFDLAIFRWGGNYRNGAVILIGGALGIFFAKYIGLYSALAILAFLAVYDIIAVYKGPVGKIAQESSGLDLLQGLSFSFKEIQMGLGDLVFYSMLTGVILFNFSSSLIPVAAAIIGILAGSVATFYMLEKRGMFPGLPFPIILGLICGLLAALLLGLSFPPVGFF